MDEFENWWKSEYREDEDKVIAREAWKAALSNRHPEGVRLGIDDGLIGTVTATQKSDYEQTDEKGRPLTYWGGLATQNSYPTVCVVCGHTLESPISGCACIYPTIKTPPNDKP